MGGPFVRSASIPLTDFYDLFFNRSGRMANTQGGRGLSSGAARFHPLHTKDQARAKAPAWSVLMFARPFENPGAERKGIVAAPARSPRTQQNLCYFVAFASQKEKRSKDLPACPTLSRRTVEALLRVPHIRGNKILVLLRSRAWGGLYFPDGTSFLPFSRLFQFTAQGPECQVSFFLLALPRLHSHA